MGRGRASKVPVIFYFYFLGLILGIWVFIFSLLNCKKCFAHYIVMDTILKLKTCFKWASSVEIPLTCTLLLLTPSAALLGAGSLHPPGSPSSQRTWPVPSRPCQVSSQKFWVGSGATCGPSQAYLRGTRKPRDGRPGGNSDRRQYLCVWKPLGTSPATARQREAGRGRNKLGPAKW